MKELVWFWGRPTTSGLWLYAHPSGIKAYMRHIYDPEKDEDRPSGIEPGLYTSWDGRLRRIEEIPQLVRYWFGPLPEIPNGLAEGRYGKLKEPVVAKG